MEDSFDNRAFRETASRLPEAIVTADPSGRITWANRGFKHLCGYQLKEIQGKKPGEFLQGPKTDPNTVQMMREALGEQRYFKTEIVNYHKKGNAYWAELSVTPCFDSDGRLEGFISVARDITRKQIKLMQMEQDVVRMYSALVSECGAKSIQSTDSSNRPTSRETPLPFADPFFRSLS